MLKDAAAIGIIGIPDEKSIAMLEKELGKPIKKIEKRNEKRHKKRLPGKQAR
ncbi:MAG: hypothetical protein PHY77_08340 [Desulfotomaculaceae bacterium]|nr:hypothetical protein [Desulfotomaculaceae bacterium]